MIENRQIPLWELHCCGKDRFEVTEIEEAVFVIVCCKDVHECSGTCDPSGAIIKGYDPNKLSLTIVKELNVYAFPSTDAEHIKNGHLTDKAIQEFLKPYEDSIESYIWVRRYSGDVDTITVLKVP